MRLLKGDGILYKSVNSIFGVVLKGLISGD